MHYTTERAQTQGGRSLISIIGSGKVGTAIAYLAASTSLDDIHLVNRDYYKSLGQQLDISSAIPGSSEISIVGTDYSEIKNSEVIVITASSGDYTNNRTEMMSGQIQMIKDVSKKIQKFAPDSKVLIVANPVDVLTYTFQKEINWPRQKVIGVASSLDSARFRYLLAEELGAKQSEIKNALVLGEHGDTMVPVFSGAKFHDEHVSRLLGSRQVGRITREVKDYWKIMRNLKGHSIFGIAKNTVDVIRAIIKNEEISAPASVLLEGEYGLDDVCMGVPVRISQEGITKIEEISLDGCERELLFQSADTIRNNIYAKQVPLSPQMVMNPEITRGGL